MKQANTVEEAYTLSMVIASTIVTFICLLWEKKQGFAPHRISEGHAETAKSLCKLSQSPVTQSVLISEVHYRNII